MIKLPAELKPDSVTVVVDTREQNAWDLTPLRTDPGTLATGDYSLRGFPPTFIAIERKASIQELISCVGSERERFERELHRLAAFTNRLVIIEASWSDLELGQWRGKITPKQAVNSILSWQSQGIPFLFAGTRENAQEYARRVLYLAAKRFWRSARLLANQQLAQRNET